MRKKVDQEKIYVTHPSTAFSFTSKGELIIENYTEQIVITPRRFKELHAFMQQIQLDQGQQKQQAVEPPQVIIEPMPCTPHVVLNCLLSLKVVRFFERLGAEQQAFVEQAVTQLIEHQEFSVRPLKLGYDETMQTSLKVPLNLLDRIPDFLDRVLFIIGAVERACLKALDKQKA